MTGKMGCGKSTVAGMFEELGARVIDVDRIGHEVLKDRSVKEELKKLFGEIIFNEDEIDRKKLAKIVFEDAEKLSALERIVHPIIREKVRRLVEDSTGVVVLDAALLRRIGLDKLCDVIVTVKCDEEKIVERLKKKGFTEEEIKRRLAAQRDVVEEGVVIENNCDLVSLRRKVRDIYNRLLGGGVGG
ncbi:dephospho-CoA kinase [Thermotoga caldifontis]|uniref:dephospho-CoA kinase n=1 Tax=Thermotoga caldifontis TaxID=1508419 RepID=UPI0022B23D59|nr:dephospho-CoA kinase [Thermotoga caldifontis]